MLTNLIPPVFVVSVKCVRVRETAFTHAICLNWRG